MHRLGSNIGCAVIAVASLCTGCRSTFDNSPAAWRTYAEQSGYRRTPRYADVVAYCRRLAAASPWVRYTTFGETGEGRALPLLVLSSERAFTPAAARRSQRPLVLLQNCIHSGECCGKDACLALARDICITRSRAELLDHVNVLIMPIFNLDGHERFGPYSRINQVGPEEMGWRVTATNLNLNRDYMKADAVEMQHWLRLWVEWQPDLLVDAHVTDGHDHQYDLMYSATTGAGVDPRLAAWTTQRILDDALPRVDAAGYLTFPYAWPKDVCDPAKGMTASGGWGPRYSTGYAGLCNRPSILLEAHSLKSYERNVLSTYHFLVGLLAVLNAHPGELRELTRTLDKDATQQRGAGPDGQVPLTVGTTDDTVPTPYRGIVAERVASPVTTRPVVRYTGEKLDVEVPLRRQNRVDSEVAPPACYLIPPQWTELIWRLDWHGVRYERLTRELSLEVDSYRFEDVSFAKGPFESRVQPKYKTVPTHETRVFRAGTVVVRTDQPKARVAEHLLEPEGPDALVAWGLMNAIFEEREYYEAYVMEPIARRMLAEDAALREEFERRIASDPEFAGSDVARLDFFYQRSPWWDAALNRYPIARLEDASVLAGAVGESN